jgi:hypothetical protein
VLLEELFERLTRDERMCLASDNAGRMYFIYDTYSVPKDVQRELNALRAYTNLFHHPARRGRRREIPLYALRPCAARSRTSRGSNRPKRWPNATAPSRSLP